MLTVMKNLVKGLPLKLWEPFWEACFVMAIDGTVLDVPDSQAKNRLQSDLSDLGYEPEI